MPKTITLRLNDYLYNKIKKAADSEHRSIASYIESVIRSHLIHKNFISNEEMEDILRNKNLIKNIKASLDDIEKGKYTIIEKMLTDKRPLTRKNCVLD